MASTYMETPCYNSCVPVKPPMLNSMINPIQIGGGGGFSRPPLRQNRDNSYNERAMTFKFSDFS